MSLTYRWWLWPFFPLVVLLALVMHITDLYGRWQDQRALWKMHRRDVLCRH